MKERYDFYALRDRSTLPDDVNLFLHDFARRLNDNELVQLILTAEKKRLFGRIRVYDSRGISLMDAEFHSGMCKQAQLDQLDGQPYTLPLMRRVTYSVLNSNLSMKKKGEIK